MAAGLTGWDLQRTPYWDSALYSAPQVLQADKEGVLEASQPILSRAFQDAPNPYNKGVGIVSKQKYCLSVLVEFVCNLPPPPSPKQPALIVKVLKLEPSLFGFFEGDLCF